METPTNGAILFPANLPNGLQTVAIGSETWRVFVRAIDAGPRVAVAQLMSGRDEIARDGTLRTVLPFWILMPVLLQLVADLIRQMFKLLRRLASEIDSRAQQDLKPLVDTALSSGVRPFVAAINHLLSRVADSASLCRRFVADAAHESRLPRTALSLPAERLDAAEMSSQAKRDWGPCGMACSEHGRCWTNS